MKGRVWWRVWLFAAFVGAWTWGLEVGAEIMEGMRTLSSWKRLRFASRRRENGVGDSSPDRIGRIKRGQSWAATCWKERMSRPECFERES